jgi:transposase
MNGEDISCFAADMRKVYYAFSVNIIMPGEFWLTKCLFPGLISSKGFSTTYTKAFVRRIYCGIINLTNVAQPILGRCIMASQKFAVEKYRALKSGGALNPRCQEVKDPLFCEHEFFDPQDLVQVKYEMLRSVKKEGRSVKEVSESFGFSRVWFYQVQAAYDERGLPGLLPQKHGPKRSHKLSEAVMDFVTEAKAGDRALDSGALSEMVSERFGLSVHPRSIERAMMRREKKRRRKKR